MGFFDHVGNDANGGRTEWKRLEEKYWDDFAQRGKKRKTKDKEGGKEDTSEERPKVKLSRKAKQRLAELSQIAKELNSVKMQEAIADLEAELK